MLGALLLVGCASGEAGAEPTPDAPEPVATAEPEPVETAAEVEVDEEANVQAWASEIAQHRHDIDEVHQRWDGATCSSLAAEEPDCGAYLVAMGLTAERVAIEVVGAIGDIGPVPDHVMELVAETGRAAAAAMVSGEAVDCPGEECVASAFEFTRAWDDLRSALAAWEPHL